MPRLGSVKVLAKLHVGDEHHGDHNLTTVSDGDYGPFEAVQNLPSEDAVCSQ